MQEMRSERNFTFTAQEGDDRRRRALKAAARAQLHESVSRDEDRQDRLELERAIGEGYADGARGPFRSSVFAAFRGTETAGSGSRSSDAPPRAERAAATAAEAGMARRVPVCVMGVPVGVSVSGGGWRAWGSEGSSGEAMSAGEEESLFAAQVLGP